MMSATAQSTPAAEIRSGVKAAEDNPNIILILGDDMPWAGTSVAMMEGLKGSFMSFRFYEQPGTPYLYDLAVDIGESKNIARAMPEKATQMYEDMNAYFDSIGAYLPKPNPNADSSYVRYDPDRDTPPVGSGRPMVTKKELEERSSKANDGGKEPDKKLTREEKEERRAKRKNQRK